MREFFANVPVPMWIIFGLMVLGIVLFARGVILSRREETSMFRFLKRIEKGGSDLQDAESHWEKLSPKSKAIVKNCLPDRIGAKEYTPKKLKEIYEKIELLGIAPSFPHDKQLDPIRKAILHDPKDDAGLRLAMRHWGTIPDDLLQALVIADPNRMFADLAHTVSRLSADAKHVIGEVFAKNILHEANLWELYSQTDDLSDCKIPEDLLRLFLQTLHSQRHTDECVAKCYLLLKDWEAANALLERNECCEDTNDLILDCLRKFGTPEMITKAASLLAKRGDLYSLSLLYEEKEIPPEHAQTCMQAAEFQMDTDNEDENKHSAAIAAECSILLKDWDHARELSKTFIDRRWSEPAGRLLYELGLAEREAAAHT